jgi:DNA-binding beta-propeller fold protein YncE
VRQKAAAPSGIFIPRISLAFALCGLGCALAVLGLAATSPYQQRKLDAGPQPLPSAQQTAQTSSPGSTCQNSANPLSTNCDTWVARYAFPGSGDDTPAAVVFSPDGSRVFVTGNTGHIQTVNDFVTVAYDTTTGAQLWLAQYDGPGHDVDQASAIGISPDGKHVYVTGKSAGPQTGNSSPSFDFATIAYDAVTGAQQWVARFNGVGSDPGLPVESGSGEPNALAVSPDGSRIFVTGQGAGTLGLQYTTVAYDPSGNQLWSASYSGTASNSSVAKSIAVSPDGTQVYVTGTTNGTTTKHDYATVAYNAASGAQNWVAQYDGPAHGYDDASSIAASPDGLHVYVTGKSDTGSGYTDLATVAYGSAAGNQQWVSRYSVANVFNLAATVKVSPNGKSVFVTGEKVTFVDQINSVSEYPTIAYDAVTGAQQWISSYPGPRNDAYVAVTLAVSPDSKSVLVLQMSGDNAGDFATVRYDATSGAQQWAAKYDGPASGLDLPKAIAVSNDGFKVVVTGASPGKETRNDFATIQYDTATGTQQWLARYNGPGTNDDEAVAVVSSPNGNTVYVTGWSENGSDHGLDYATLAYDATTGMQRWASRYHRTDNSFEIARAMAISHNGRRLYVTGYTDAGYNGAPSQYTTIAYDAATGARLWTAFFTAPFNSDIDIGTAQAIAVSPDDSRIYVTGNVTGSTNHFTSYNEFGTVAYDASTGSVIWTAYYAGTAGLSNSDNIPWAIGVTPDGNHVVVAGQVSNTSSPLDFGTVAYDAATGAQQWAAIFNGQANGSDVVRALAVSPDSSEVFVTGESFGLNNAYAYQTIAYNIADGSQRWAATYTGPAGTGDLPAAIAASPDGKRVYVTGLSDGNGTGGDYGTVAYDANTGTQAWVARYAQPGSDLGMAIAVSPDSSLVFVTGESAGATTHGDYATIFYDAAGNEKFTGRYDGSASADDVAGSIAVSPDGSRVFVTGVSPGLGTGSDYATIAYNTALVTGAPGPSPTPTPVPVTGVVSMKTHGDAGSFVVDLPLGDPAGVECRTNGGNGNYTMVFSFTNSLTTVAGASVINGTGRVSTGSIASDPHHYVVELTGVSNAQVITVSLTNVTDSAGNFSSAIAASMDILIGDVNGSGLVDSGDVFLVRQQTGQSVSASTFREDVNASGVIDSGDVFLTRQQTGTSLP